MPKKIRHHRKKNPESVDNPLRMFAGSPRTSNQESSPRYTQTVTVTVNVDEKDDCLTGCFKAIASCIRR